jgi:hypothetical protein
MGESGRHPSPCAGTGVPVLQARPESRAYLSPSAGTGAPVVRLQARPEPHTKVSVRKPPSIPFSRAARLDGVESTISCGRGSTPVVPLIWEKQSEPSIASQKEKLDSIHGACDSPFPPVLASGIAIN